MRAEWAGFIASSVPRLSDASPSDPGHAHVNRDGFQRLQTRELGRRQHVRLADNTVHAACCCCCCSPRGCWLLFLLLVVVVVVVAVVAVVVVVVVNLLLKPANWGDGSMSVLQSTQSLLI